VLTLIIAANATYGFWLRLSYELRVKEMFMSGSGVIMNGGVSRLGGTTIF